MVLPVDLIDCRLILLMQVVLLMVLLTVYLMVSISMLLVCMIIGMRLVSINMLSHAYPLTTRYWAPDHSNTVISSEKHMRDFTTRGLFFQK